MTCLNPKSIIDEEWDSEYEPSIYIELLDYYDTIYEDKKFCFRRDELESLINTPVYQVGKWFMDLGYANRGYVFNDDGWVIDPAHPEQKHAFGYPSKVEKYIRVPINEWLTFYVLQENLESVLLKDDKDFIGIVIDITRVGKNYTISGAHGQLPKVQIYYLVPRLFYEQSPEKVYNEIYSVIFKIKFSNIMNPNLEDIIALNGNVIANVDSGASPQPIMSHSSASSQLIMSHSSASSQPIMSHSSASSQPIMNHGGAVPSSVQTPGQIFRQGSSLDGNLYITEDDVNALTEETPPYYLDDLFNEYTSRGMPYYEDFDKMIKISKKRVRQNPRIPMTRKFISFMDVDKISTSRLKEILEAYQLSTNGDRDTLEDRFFAQFY
jgi:hypothetical protein